MSNIAAAAPPTLLHRLRARARDAHLAWQTRQILANLDEHLCADIGHPYQEPSRFDRTSAWMLAVTG